MLFDARLHERDGWQLVGVVGDLDLATLPRLRAATDALTGPAVGVDLTAAAYLDTVALGVLLGARVRALRVGSRFAVVCPPGPVHDLLVEAGVADVLGVVATVEELDA